MSRNEPTDLSDEDRRDPYFNAETGESLRTLVAEYAEQAGELSDQVIVQAIHWHQERAAEAEFYNSFPEVIYFGEYSVARDLRDFQAQVHPWLQSNVGNGGYWNYDTTRNPREVIIDPLLRDWSWGQYGYFLGFKRASDAVNFKLAHDTGVEPAPPNRPDPQSLIDALRQRLQAGTSPLK